MMWALYLGFSGLTDILSGLAMQGGIWLHESFVFPPAARSPRDFWGQRWNLFIHRFAARNIFVPFGGRRRPLRAMAAVFIASGLLHEYLVLASGGTWSPYAGYMMLFFALHGLAAGVQTQLERRHKRARLPRPVAVALHQAWMTCTAPLFFAPLQHILEAECLCS